MRLYILYSIHILYKCVLCNPMYVDHLQRIFVLSHPLVVPFPGLPAEACAGSTLRSVLV